MKQLNIFRKITSGITFNLKNWCMAAGLQMLVANMVCATESVPTFVPKKIISGSKFTCLLSTTGQLKCWGSNHDGALGVGSSINFGDSPYSMGSTLPIIDLGKDVLVKDMCGGDHFSCAVSTTGRVKCWGNNYIGQLGQEKSRSAVGDISGDMGDNLPWTNLGSDFIATNVQCEQDSVCALSTKGQVKCWGDNRNVELGHSIAGRGFVGNKAGDMGDNLPYLSLPPVKSIAVGSHHGCAASTDAIFCWGNNQYGQAGIESSERVVELPVDPKDAVKVKLEDEGVPTTIHSLVSGGGHICAEYSAGISTKKKIKCWGSNRGGQLGIGSEELIIGKKPGTMGSKLSELQLDSSNFIQLETYGSISCALKRNGTVQCWGFNYYGQLGLGDTIDRGKKPQELGDKLETLNLSLPVLALSHGPESASTCALLINHELKCWGLGEYGQLGYEDTISRGDKPSHMGENLPFVRYK